jgi:hypothetical protein
MQAFKLLALIVLAAFFTPAQLWAHEDEQPGTPGHEELGQVNFPISCDATAQKEFNRGVAILHSFYYPDAVRSFTKATELDPVCAMGYWGIAMSSWYPLWYPPSKEALMQGRTAVEHANSASKKTARERDYIAAIGMFYQDFEKLDHKSRALAYEKAMEQVYRRMAAAPARFAVERRHWSEAAALIPLPSGFPATLAVSHYARALGAARSGAVDEAQKDVDKLVELRDALLQAKQDYWAKQVDIQRQTAELVRKRGFRAPRVTASQNVSRDPVD